MARPIEIGDISAMGHRYLDGQLKQHRLHGEFEVSRRSSIQHLGDVGDRQRELWRQRGLAEVRNDSVIFGVLAAGASSRMDLSKAPDEVREMMEAAGIAQLPTSKALVPVALDRGRAYAFLDLFLENVRRFAEPVGVEPNTLVFVSEKNRADIAEHIRNAFGEQTGLVGRIHTLVQQLAPQIVASRADVVDRKENFEDEAAWRRACELSSEFAGHNLDVPKPAGHGEFLHQLIASGLVPQLLENGVRHLSIRNIDNVPAVLDDAWLTLFGYMLEENQNLLVEVSQRADGQKGGALIRHEQQWRLAEDPSFAGTGVSASESFFINNAVAIIKLDYLFPIYQTTAEELMAARAAGDDDKLAEIADRGRQRFPTIVEAKPVTLPSGGSVGAITPETNMWESTSVAGDQPLCAFGVFSEADQGKNISQHAVEEQRERCRLIRFAPVKKWSDYCEADKKVIIRHTAERILHGQLVDV
ncbi:MAG: UTP--glucose-1-phosphate uridylyltransferase [Pirellulaceae bacterium]|nr:UTP--glucose-1-phosphate uridylyltransferase [Pirellulaceae bacterium]MDP7019034.1 UTP--glucose-1-phosphate uridylyltransferase [Pirellulaceae bacterium]